MLVHAVGQKVKVLYGKGKIMKGFEGTILKAYSSKKGDLLGYYVEFSLKEKTIEIFLPGEISPLGDEEPRTF